MKPQQAQEVPEVKQWESGEHWVGNGACLPWVLLGTCECCWLLVSNWNGGVIPSLLLLRGLVLSALACLLVGTEEGLAGHVPLWNIMFEDLHAGG